MNDPADVEGVREDAAEQARGDSDERGCEQADLLSAWEDEPPERPVTRPVSASQNSEKAKPISEPASSKARMMMIKTTTIDTLRTLTQSTTWVRPCDLDLDLRGDRFR